MKNGEDTFTKNKNSNGICLDLQAVYTSNHEHNLFKEKFNNKFCVQFPQVNDNTVALRAGGSWIDAIGLMVGGFALAGL